MTPEGRIEQRLKDRVRETGGEIRKLQWIARNGAPDRFVFYPPRATVECRSAANGIPGETCPVFAFVEVKREGEKPTTQQAREHSRLRAAGFKVFVVDSFFSIETVITDLTARIATPHI